MCAKTHLYFKILKCMQQHIVSGRNIIKEIHCKQCVHSGRGGCRRHRRRPIWFWFRHRCCLLTTTTTGHFWRHIIRRSFRRLYFTGHITWQQTFFQRRICRILSRCQRIWAAHHTAGRSNKTKKNKNRNKQLNQINAKVINWYLYATNSMAFNLFFFTNNLRVNKYYKKKPRRNESKTKIAHSNCWDYGFWFCFVGIDKE